MTKTDNLIKAARLASGIGAVEAAKILGVSYPTYKAREDDISKFKVEELNRLYENMDECGRKIMEEYTTNFFTQ